MEKVVSYKALDGKMFDSEQDCEKYENDFIVDVLDKLDVISVMCENNTTCSECPFNKITSFPKTECFFNKAMSFTDCNKNDDVPRFNRPEFWDLTW